MKFLQNGIYREMLLMADLFEENRINSGGERERTES